MLSIVVSWRDRHELKVALPGLLAACRSVGGDLTIVNFSGSASLLEDQLGEHRSAVRVAHVPGQRYFNKAAAQNIGAASSIQPVLFFCDCDIVVQPAEIVAFARELHDDPTLFGTLAGVSESVVNSRGGRHVVSFGYELRIRTQDGRQLRIVDSEEDAESGTRQAPGLLLVSRRNFEQIGGYNSDLHGWGWEDQDMISRLTLGLGLTRRMQGYAVHLSHDDHARIAHYPQVSSRWESRDRMFRTALANYDAANFTGSYQRDRAQLLRLLEVREPRSHAAVP